MPRVSIEGFPIDVQEKLIELSARVSVRQSAWEIWRWHIAPDDRQRLGGHFERAYDRYGTIHMWMKVTGVSAIRALLDVACTIHVLTPKNYLSLLRETGESDGHEVLSRAIESGALVLTEDREAYFDRSPIECNWHTHEKKWGFLWELARQSKRGKWLDHFALGVNAEPRVVSDYKNRLKCLIPPDLYRLIISVRNAGCRIELPPEMIRLFIFDPRGELVEGTGWEPATDL